MHKHIIYCGPTLCQTVWLSLTLPYLILITVLQVKILILPMQLNKLSQRSYKTYPSYLLPSCQAQT
jgi:hypothetical protein